VKRKISVYYYTNVIQLLATTFTQPSDTKLKPDRNNRCRKFTLHQNY